MTTEPKENATPSPAPTPMPTIHEADLAAGPSGGVWYGIEIDFDTAVARRQAGMDVIVRGENGDENRRLAYRIEATVGPPSRPQPPERRAGPLALPHFHQQSRNPKGHLFYETEHRKARKRT
jgi:hypothetical protein